MRHIYYFTRKSLTSDWSKGYEARRVEVAFAHFMGDQCKSDIYPSWTQGKTEYKYKKV